MKSTDPLLGRWRKTLAGKGSAPAILQTDGHSLRTFAEIEERVSELEATLDGLAAGQVLAVQIGNHPDWPSVLLACLARGVIVLPLETSISQTERRAALQVCQASALASADADGSIEIRRIVNREIDWHGRAPSLLKLTSGTTAAPRAVCFHSEQLLADCDNICETMEITDEDLNFGVIPVSHSYGFSNLLTPLIARGVPMVLSRDRLPRAVLEDLARSRATVFPGMPVFYQAFCEIEKPPPLPNLRLCISAGAPLNASLAKDFREKFNQPIHSFYGSSECGGICYDPDGTNFEDGFVGNAMNRVQIEICEPGATSSQIRVRSAAVGDGYFPEADEAKLGNGVFVPDDLLARVIQGATASQPPTRPKFGDWEVAAPCYKIVGRISDVINVAGKKVNPAEIEAQLLAFAGVREAVAFGRRSSRRNEEVAACVVADSGISEVELQRFCRKHLSGWQVPRRIFIVDQIPTNERGKTSRRELALRFAE